jgi:hypothetical protein
MAIAQERAAQAAGWLAEQGGAGRSVAMGEALGLDHAQRARAIQAGIDAGWIRRVGSGALELLPAGWALLAAAAGSASGGEALDRLLERVWPSWASPHAAYTRLIVSAVIAKYCLWEKKPDGHLVFASIGRPGIGKTVVLEIVCHFFGWDWRRHIRRMDTETQGSTRGRREHDGERWRLEAPDTDGLPLVMLDELDKAPVPARAQAWRYLHGQGRVWAEGEMHELRPVAMVGANCPRAQYSHPWGLLPEGTVRRAVLLNPVCVDERRVELGDHLGEAMRALSPADRIALDRVAMPAEELEQGAREILRGLGRFALEALDSVPRRGLELAALGRLALLGDGDHVRAALATAADYLACMSTTPGLIDPGWPQALAALAEQADQDSGHGVVAVIENAQQAQAEARAQTRRTSLAEQAGQDALVRDRAELAEGLRRLRARLDGRHIARWDDERRRRAAGLRAVLERLQQDAVRTRSRPALDEVMQRAEEPVTRSLALLETARREAEQAQQARAEQQRAAQEQREQRERARRQRAALDAEQKRRTREYTQQQEADLRETVATATPLEHLWNRQGPPRSTADGPARVLADAGLITFHPREAPGRIARLLNVAAGTWQTWDGRPLGHGTRTECRALDVWGPAVRRVLAPRLAELHAREDGLRAALGRQPRTARPAVLAPRTGHTEPGRALMPVPATGLGGGVGRRQAGGHIGYAPHR